MLSSYYIILFYISLLYYIIVRFPLFELIKKDDRSKEHRFFVNELFYVLRKIIIKSK